MSKLKAEIDQDLCFGSGECVRLVPGAFELSDEGFSIVLDDAATIDADTLRAAERTCPSGALQVSED